MVRLRFYYGGASRLETAGSEGSSVIPQKYWLGEQLAQKTASTSVG
jgi:hypothetical protein